jgi:tight adherence protein B
MIDLQAYYPIIFYITSAVAAIFIGESLYVAVSGALGRKRGINRRVRTQGGGLSNEEALIEFRRERGIVEGGSLDAIGDLSRLLIQSGLRLTLVRLLSMMFGIGAIAFAAPFFLTKIGLVWSLLAALIVGTMTPLLILRRARSRRQAKLASQLPDAIDVIVRSLRSGHPIPVAMSMVGREMADPIGTEFGMAVDEMTYGLNTEQALKNMSERTGAADLSLLVIAVSLQTSTGGNLSVILSNLAKVMRERFQLRRKVRSLSAEGRISAYGLTIIPILLFLWLNFRAPHYYGDVWNEPIFLPVMIGAAIWGLIGDLIMFKMINFKY